MDYYLKGSNLMSYCEKCKSALPEGALFCPRCGAHVSPDSAKLAFWGERFVAYLIDGIIVGLISYSLSLFLSVAAQFSFLPRWLSWIPFFNFSLHGVLLFLYWILMDGVYGQSIGKMVMCLRVTTIQGKPITMSQAALESVGKAFFLPVDFLVGLFLYQKRRQRVFNFLSQTIVVRKR